MTRYDQPLPPNAQPARRVRVWAARLLTALLLTTAISMPLAAQPQPAIADTVPPDASLPTTVSSDPLPTAQHNGVVWSQVVVGNTVYAAGEFTRARPAGTAKGSAAEVVRTNVLAYNITTGALTSFAPTMNGKVKDIAASPDGSVIYIGGQFTQVNGVTRNRLAAFNTSTGALLTGFAPNVNFTVNGACRQRQHRLLRRCLHRRQRRCADQRRRGGSAHRSHPAVQPHHDRDDQPERTEAGRLPDGDKVVIGGNFETVNGSNNPGYGLALLDATTGASLPMPVNSLIRNGQETAGDHRFEGDHRGLLRNGLRLPPNARKFRGRLQGRLERQPDLGRGLPR